MTETSKGSLVIDYETAGQRRTMPGLSMFSMDESSIT